MPGGLIEIVTYGNQDLFLTGTPEITFFKIVYRRHTNFSIESFKVGFDDDVGFGLKSSIILPRIGDLVHKCYLEITLPEVDIRRKDFILSELPPDCTGFTESEYQKILTYMTVHRNAYIAGYEEFIAEGTESSDMTSAILDVYTNTPGIATIRSDFDFVINVYGSNSPYERYFNSNGRAFIEMADLAAFNLDPKETVFAIMNQRLRNAITVQEFFYEKVLAVRDLETDNTDPNIKFAWVDRIGHSIIEYIEVLIGGHRVDKHWGDWINIWYELTANRDMEETYFKMIGNVSTLTTFDRNAKPQYKLRVPLHFWFNRFNGLALPLVALQYHDVSFEVKFRKLEDVSYIENGVTVDLPGFDEGLTLSEVSADLGINIEAEFLIDYIYLATKERKRFAQASHEYLIEQVQRLEVKNIDQPQFECNLNNFHHPVKEMIWVAQKQSYTENLTGFTQLRWDNYSLTDTNEGNPIIFSTINFHSEDRVQRRSGSYYNYVQPWQHHNTTPSDGINVYSYSLFPEEHQPSGSANYSRLSRVRLNVELDPILFPIGREEIMDIRIYVRSINILRFISGMGGCSFVYG